MANPRIAAGLFPFLQVAEFQHLVICICGVHPIWWRVGDLGFKLPLTLLQTIREVAQLLKVRPAGPERHN